MSIKMKTAGTPRSGPDSHPPPPIRNSNVKFYILFISILAFALISYIFNSIDKMENTLSSMGGSSSIVDKKAEGVETSSVTGLKKAESDEKWEPFNTTNPHASSFCPDAKCLNSPLCLPCNRRHFLIISTARSGSTTLLRMFNALPNMRLSGENHNTLWFISQLTDNLLENRPNLLKHPVDKPIGPFSHNTIPRGSMGCIAQQITHNLNPPPLAVQQDKSKNMEDYDDGLILGFKTVRLHKENWTAMEAAKFLKEHFPCTKVLINYQTNVTHQYLSFKHTFNHTGPSEDDNGPSIDKLEEINEFQEQLHNHLKQSSKLIDMDKWTKDVEILNDVVDWIGYEKCRFKEIVHENDGGYATDNKTDLSVGDECAEKFKVVLKE
jgi:hypothetical protein